MKMLILQLSILSIFGAYNFAVSAEESVCAGGPPNVILEPRCQENPRLTFCEVTGCEPGFQMANILGVVYGYRKQDARSVYVLCRNGTWVTNHENRHFGIKDICLPEVSAEESVCAGGPPNVILEPRCQENPRLTFCEVTGCEPGFQMANILGVVYGYRKQDARSVYVLCRNGTWVTNHEHRHFGIKDICLPEAEFQKCPMSIPHGNLERHCGPATDWLCKFECIEGYHAHAYMSGILKNFFDGPDMLYCDNGIWKTGYEELGVDIAGVCVSQEHNCTDSDDIPHGQVPYLPCPSGYTCGLECDPGYHKHALSWDDPSCENGVWVLRTTKHDASITPQTICVPDDSVGVCPRNIQHGQLRDPACTRKCSSDCDEGYHVPRRVPVMWLSCEGGKWFTSEEPYNADNVCFPEGGHVCPYAIPNGVMSEREYWRADDGRSRAYEPPTCNDGYREHRSMLGIECIAGEWVTGQERFGLDVSKLCIRYNP